VYTVRGATQQHLRSKERGRLTSPAAAPEPMAREALAHLDGAASQIKAADNISVADLLHKMESLPVIEQSKGVLSGYFGISPDDAFNLLRRWSSHNNRKIRDISQLVVAAASQGPSNKAELRLLFKRLGG
jgi:hypothetical protein